MVPAIAPHGAMQGQDAGSLEWFFLGFMLFGFVLLIAVITDFVYQERQRRKH
jgi:hypothetical protein